MTPHHYDRQCRCDECTSHERELTAYFRREDIQAIIRLGKKLEWHDASESNHWVELPRIGAS